MADTWTPNFSLGKPEIGGARGRWGTVVNDTIDSVDLILKRHDDGINASLKLAGGAMTGAITLSGNNNGLVYSAGTRVFDDTNASGGKTHFTYAAGDSFIVRSADGFENMLVIDRNQPLYRGQKLLTTADAGALYIGPGGGTINGNLVVNGELKTLSVRHDERWVDYVGGVNCVLQFDNDLQYVVNREAKSHAWTSAGAVRMSVDSGGNLLVTGDLIAYSDENLKQDIEVIPNALDLLAQVRGVEYRLKADDRYQTGVIAQEIEKVFPHAVTVDPSGMKRVSYLQLIGPMLAAINELGAKVKELEAKING